MCTYKVVGGACKSRVTGLHIYDMRACNEPCMGVAHKLEDPLGFFEKGRGISQFPSFCLSIMCSIKVHTPASSKLRKFQESCIVSLKITASESFIKKL